MSSPLNNLDEVVTISVTEYVEQQPFREVIGPLTKISGFSFHTSVQNPAILSQPNERLQISPVRFLQPLFQSFVFGIQPDHESRTFTLTESKKIQNKPDQSIDMADGAGPKAFGISKELMNCISEQNIFYNKALKHPHSSSLKKPDMEFSSLLSDIVSDIENSIQNNVLNIEELTNVLPAQDLTGKIICDILELLEATQVDLSFLVKTYGTEKISVEYVPLKSSLADDHEDKTLKTGANDLMAQFGL